MFRIEIETVEVSKVETKQKLADYFQFSNTRNDLPYKINTLTSKKYADTKPGDYIANHTANDVFQEAQYS